MTNILETELAAKCSTPFVAASGDQHVQVSCCTSDLTFAEFKTVKGKMDAGNNDASTVTEYMDATASWRTDLYAAGSHGKRVTHAESVELIKMWGLKATLELKTYTPGEGMPTYDEIRHPAAVFPFPNRVKSACIDVLSILVVHSLSSWRCIKQHHARLSTANLSMINFDLCFRLQALGLVCTKKRLEA